MHHATRRTTHTQFPRQDTTCAQINWHRRQRDVRHLVRESLARPRVDGREGVEIEPARRLREYNDHDDDT